VLSGGRIIDITDVSDSTKLFRIRVDSPDFEFKPGQWVDLFIPSIDTIGGFSLVSAPSELPELQLAIKYSSTHGFVA
jgi:NAD(P)H-flavin reductase